jgi:hypothetical protein
VDRGMISRVKNTVTILAPLLLLAVLQVHACSWAVGLFYQVTALKGQVVGTTYRGLPRWLRQSFAKKHAKLVLYEYRWPRARNDMPPIVKTLETDDKGMFNFGPLQSGHYSLEIVGEDWFDVEIKDLPQATESVTIDVSPVYPDCTGGHEFNVNTRR